MRKGGEERADPLGVSVPPYWCGRGEGVCLCVSVCVRARWGEGYGQGERNCRPLGMTVPPYSRGRGERGDHEK